jgi:hypothetical protein
MKAPPMRGSAGGALEYRPGVLRTLVASGVWSIAAVLVAWMGVILGPEDRAAMDGFALLLFTVVPIRAFCWTMAPLLAGLGVYLAHRGLAGAPSLALSSEGMTLRSGRAIPWSEVTSTAVTPKGELLIEVDAHVRSTEPASTRWRPMRSRGVRRADQLALSSFDLGTNAQNVAAEVEKRMIGRRDPR